MSPIIKRKGERFTIPSKYLLFILTLFCAAIMVFTLSTDVLNKPLNSAAGYVIVPFQDGITKIASWLTNRSEELVQIRQLLEENSDLRQQVADLTSENTILMQEKTELNRLRQLYKLDTQYDEYTKVGARIISRDSGNWYYSFVINKGEEDGFLVDMNVIAEGGLVGIITAVGPNWSRVTAVIADNSNVSASTLTTSDNLIVSGNLKEMSNNVILFSKLVDSDNNVAVGDKVVTSSISDKYLPNILVGYIHTINNDSNNLTKSGYITPAVDFEHLEEVLVIMEMKQQITD